MPEPVAPVVSESEPEAVAETAEGVAAEPVAPEPVAPVAAEPETPAPVAPAPPVKPVPATPAGSRSGKVADGTRRGHSALMALDFDREHFAPDATVFVTQAEFAGLKAARVFDGEWEGGVEEGGVGEGGA
ncbi:hypothetical protein [Brevundimonas sp.]|uniref:hypothetical protein n=1 Tax=Brevundimonas sp. TaxID=1871086 RepID=UPI00257EBE6C|nr:hypothetical protein [Brevundimonas sp.]